MRDFSTISCRPLAARLRLCLLAVPLVAAGAALAAEEEFPGVEKLMSESEFREAGLDKLSADEVRALDAWLLRYTAGEAEVLQQTNEAVREAEREQEVSARLGDDFDGWDGKTVFRLDNGQIWQQRLDGRYRYRGPANPAVRISKNWLGFFKMTLVDEDRSVGVTRVR